MSSRIIDADRRMSLDGEVETIRIWVYRYRKESGISGDPSSLVGRI